MEKIETGIEVGSKIIIEGRTYWVTDIGPNEIGFMLDPDDVPKPSYKTDWGSFWRIFWCILFIAFILKMVL